MYQRMDSESQRLEWLGLTHNSSYEAMLRRITGGEDISSTGETSSPSAKNEDQMHKAKTV